MALVLFFIVALVIAWKVPEPKQREQGRKGHYVSLTENGYKMVTWEGEERRTYMLDDATKYDDDRKAFYFPNKGWVSLPRRAKREDLVVLKRNGKYKIYDREEIERFNRISKSI